jgi:hypothetical protein
VGPRTGWKRRRGNRISIADASGRTARNLVTILTELSRLFGCIITALNAQVICADLTEYASPGKVFSSSIAVETCPPDWVALQRNV